MLKLDHFLSKKKEPAQVLDLSRVKITSKDDFKRCLDKIPECKVKPEKILPDQVKIKEKDFTFVSGKKEEKLMREWSYPDPIPTDMKGVKLEDICPINIDWKMLTTQRPKSKVEEEFFSRLVQLGKLDLKYQQSLRLQKSTDWIRRTKNPKSSIIEMRVLSCKECGEDFCDGSACSKLTYENFFRPQPTTSDLGQGMSLLAAEFDGKPSKRKKKRKQKKKRKTMEEGGHKSKKKSGRKKLGKSSIFNRPASVGCTRDHSREKGMKTEKSHKPRASSLTRSRSSEGTRHHRISQRSKSAPRIHFDFDTPGNSDSECRRRDYISDSAPSNTDYSSQSDTDSAEKQFISPRLRLSGRRKLLSARVSFAEKKEQKESTEFIRQCTLNDKNRFNDSEKFRTMSARSSPFKYSENVFPKFSSSFPFKAPATVQIELDEQFSTWDNKLSRVALPVTHVYLKKTCSGKKGQTKLKKRAETASTLEFRVTGSGQEPEDKDKITLTRKSKTKINHHSLRSDFITPECCLKAKGLFKKSTH